MTTFNKSDYHKKMESTLESLHKEFVGLRTGRASVSLIEPVMVEAYGSRMPMNQVGTVNVPEARLITVQVWDKGMVKNVEKAIRDAGLGLNPTSEGQIIRVPLPDLTMERRKELCKVAGKYGEAARVAIRNIRRSAMDDIKVLEKDAHLSEDDMHRFNDEVQKMTDDFIKKVDENLLRKEQDIMQV